MSESTAAGDATPPDIRVRRGNPTDEELAALIAVVGGAYLEESAEPAIVAPARSRWELSARGLRRPLDRERRWGGFSG
ncbi:acyl-CoA carboxylase epsilon subunit-like protein [Microbacterium sp. AG1240]|uniref:acyl-CoA carboxylase subunit epsilon n=1 Tax=Microbacterium sp. AG1240 TaxID=2183992 RepID=UPI000EAD4F34|nr:acyl-CoA carboxylase subunit epsilon [Microbacterium sp. AG1240]RKT36319.1 acyl-CoA carboxylase epsilon subunit-like protein [Microbacterium sp. AG1240]